MREWYSALMDYGAMLKKTEGNMNVRSAHYMKQAIFEGSRRQVRGAILRLASKKGAVKVDDFRQYVSAHSVMDIISELAKEGFLKKEGKRLGWHNPLSFPLKRESRDPRFPPTRE